MRRNGFAAVAVAVLVATFLVGCGKENPPAPVFPVDRCVSEDEQREHGVSVPSPGSTYNVDGLIYGSGDTAIIFANQVDWKLCGWKPFQENLAQRGYLTATFNYAEVTDADDDVLALVAEVRRRGAKSVFLIGASKGGTAVLSAGARATPAVDGVVSVSGPASHDGVSAEAKMIGYPVPVLFIAATFDSPFTEDAQQLYDACTQPDKKLVFVGGTGHGTALLDEGTMKTVDTFLTSHRHSQ
jgi:predicted alpha/beta hydrolase family esterase